MVRVRIGLIFFLPFTAILRVSPSVNLLSVYSANLEVCSAYFPYSSADSHRAYCWNTLRKRAPSLGNHLSSRRAAAVATGKPHAALKIDRGYTRNLTLGTRASFVPEFCCGYLRSHSQLSSTCTLRAPLEIYFEHPGSSGKDPQIFKSLRFVKNGLLVAGGQHRPRGSLMWPVLWFFPFWPHFGDPYKLSQWPQKREVVKTYLRGKKMVFSFFLNAPWGSHTPCVTPFSPPLQDQVGGGCLGGIKLIYDSHASHTVQWNRFLRARTRRSFFP